MLPRRARTGSQTTNAAAGLRKQLKSFTDGKVRAEDVLRADAVPRQIPPKREPRGGSETCRREGSEGLALLGMRTLLGGMARY